MRLKLPVNASFARRAKNYFALFSHGKKRNTIILSILFVAISAILLSQLGLFTTHAAGITKYARTAGGNWSADATWSTTSGGGADTVAPTSADDVVMDANSGNVTIDANVVAKTLIQTGYTNVLTSDTSHGCTVSGTITLLSGKYVASGDGSAFIINATSTLTTGGNAMGTVVVTGSAIVTLGDNYTGRAGPLSVLRITSGSINLNGKTVSGNSTINRLIIQSTTVGTPMTITVNGGTFANADFQDIAFANGGASLNLSAITGLSGDCGNNSMSGGGTLTFTTAAPQTWTNVAGGSWSTSGNWTSRVPLPQDTVAFGTLNAGPVTINVDMPRIGGNVSFAGATNLPTVNLNTSGLTYTFYGSVNLNGVGTFTNSKNVTFASRTNATLTSNGKTWCNNAGFLYIAMPSATLTLGDVFYENGSGTYLTNGTLTTTYGVTVARYITSAGTTTNMGNGTWTLTYTQNIWTGSGTINCGSSTIVINSYNSTAIVFAGGTNTYNNITIAPGSGILTFSGAFTFANMTMSSPGAKIVKFTNGTTYTMTGNSFLTGTADNPTQIINPTTLNGGFETAGGGGADVFGSWSESTAGTSTINAESGAGKYAGTYSARLDIDSSNSVAQLTQNILTVGKTYKATAYIKVASGSPAGGVRIGTTSAYTAITPTTSYIKYISYFTADITGFSVVRGLNTGNNSIYIDNVTLQETNAAVVSSDTAGSQFTLSKISGTVIADYDAIQDSNVTGGAKWYLTANSVNVSNNTGWTASGAGNVKTVSPTGGNWSATTAWNEGSPPSASDDVVATSASGNLTIDSGTPVAKSANFSGYGAHTLSHTTGIGLTVSGNLNFCSAMTYTPADDTSAIIINGTGTITTAGKSMGNFTVAGSGITVTMADNFTTKAATTTVTLTQGTLKTDGASDNSGLTHSWGKFYADNANVRAINLGNSSITITGTGIAWYGGSLGNFSVTKGTSTITLSGATASFSGNNAAYNNVSLTGSGVASIYTYGGSYVNLTRIGTATATDSFAIKYASAQTINGALTLAGNSATNRLLVQSDTVGTARAITLGASATFKTNSSNVDFQDITVTGGAANERDLSAIPGNSGDCGGNTGITFTTAAPQTWTNAAGGSWSTSGNWTSRVPLPQDTVAFGSLNSGPVTITVDMPRIGKDVSFASATNLPTVSISNAISIYGSLNLTGVGTWTNNNWGFTFAGRSNSSLTTNGKTLCGGTITFNMVGATLTFLDAANLGGSISLSYGTISTNYNVTCYRLITYTGTTVNMGSGTWTLTAVNGGLATITGTINGQSSTVALTYTGATATSFDVGTATFNNITIAPGSGVLTFSGAFSFANMTMASAGTKTVKFTKSTQYNMTGTSFLNGTSGNLVTIDSDDGATQFTLNKTSGTVIADYDAISRSNVTGGARWYMTANSSGTGNTGWTASGSGIKTISPTGGNWSATTAWNEGAVPTSSDDVVAIASSGNLTIDSGSPVAKTLNLANYGTHTLSHTSGIGLTISGDMTFVSTMTYTPADDTAKIIINGTSNITTAGKQLGNFEVSGSGITATFQDSFTQRATTTTLTLTQGTLNTNNQAVSVGTIKSSDNNTKTLTLGSSNLTLSGTAGLDFNNSMSGITISPGSSNITFTGANVNAYPPNNSTWNNFTFAGGGASQIARITTLANLTVTGTAAKTDSFGTTGATINGTLTLAGNSVTNRLLIITTVGGVPAPGTTKTLSAAAVAFSNVDFMDIAFTGTMTVNSATSIGDCGGNSGTNWSTMVTPSTTQTWTNAAGGSWSTAGNWTSRVPLPQDTVAFGSLNAGPVTITVDMPRMGKDVSFASATNLPTVTMNTTGLTYSVYGSLNLTGVGTFTRNKATTFGARANASLTSNGKAFGSGGTTVAMPGATLTLADIYSDGSSITVSNGTLTTNSNVTAYGLVTSAGTTVNMGSGTWSLSSQGTIFNVAGTINAGSSTIATTYTGATATAFAGGTNTYNNITIAPGSGVLTFSGAFTFANMTMASAGTKTVKFTKSTQYNMTGTSFLSGTSGNVVTIDSDDGATAFTLSKSSGIVTSNYLSLKNSTATGGAKWYGANSTNAGNNSGWMFSAKSPGYVSASPSGYSRTNSFTFSWAVTGPDAALYANKYQYRISPSGTWIDVPGDAATSSISPTAPAYQIGSNVFYLRAVDITGNADPSGPQTTFYYNADAPSAPVALTADPSSSATNSFSFSWTPPVTHSGNISGYYYSINSLPTITNSTFTTATSLPTAPYATQQGTNTIYVLAKDEAGNVSFDSCSSISGNTDEDSCSSATFAANTTAPAIPLGLTAVDGSDRDAREYQVFLVWDAPATQSLDFAQYDIYRSDDNQYFSLVGTTTSTSYSDTGLASQPYYYYVKSKNNADNESAQSATVTMTPTGRYTSAPALSDGPTVIPKVFSASIAWDTDREATSIVKYSKDKSNLDKEASHATEFVKAHQIDIQGLDPESIYYYQLLWIDQDGNQGTKSDLSFTTGAKPKIESVKISNITLNSATISWSSTTASTSNINYGESVSYGSSVQEQSGSQTTNHTLNLTNLKDSSKYHFQITGIDTDNTALTSDDYSFNTLTKPSISGLTYEPVTDAPTTTLKFNFKTNIPTTTIISYQINSGIVKNQSNSDYQQDHEMIIHDLADASTYTFQAKGVDQYGNTVQSDKKTFTTANDTRPPKVSNLTIEVKATGFSDSQKAQVVASWVTDEASTSFIQYGQGISGSDYPNKTNEDSVLTTNHVIILSQLDPNKIYHLRVASADKSGNIGYSPDTTTITGKIQSSVVDIIITALKNSLWWLFGLW
jgi:hypothetical protein